MEAQTKYDVQAGAGPSVICELVLARTIEWIVPVPNAFGAWHAGRQSHVKAGRTHEGMRRR